MSTPSSHELSQTFRRYEYWSLYRYSAHAHYARPLSPSLQLPLIDSALSASLQLPPIDSAQHPQTSNTTAIMHSSDASLTLPPLDSSRGHDIGRISPNTVSQDVFPDSAQSPTPPHAIHKTTEHEYVLDGDYTPKPASGSEHCLQHSARKASY